VALPVRLPSWTRPGGSWVTRGAWRRWSVVLSGAAALCAIPAVIAALPVPGSTISAAALRARILASAAAPYQGYAESTVSLGLPQLPRLHNVSNLLDGTTDQYVWYRSPGYWRADEVTAAGESDTYEDGGVTYLWTYGRNLLTQVTGAEPVRLPRAADLLPPALAQRLVGLAGPADHYTRLPSRRVAGVAAAGLRLTPASPDTTIGHIDVWADPRTGLPVEVQVVPRGAAAPVLVSSFLEVSQTRPDLSVVTPHPAPDLGLTTTRLPDVDGVLNGDGDGDHDGTPFPARLAGLSHVAIPGGPPGIAVYGTGFARMVLLPLPSSEGSGAVTAAIQAGAGTVPVSGPTTGVLIRTPLLNVVMVTAGFHHATFLFAGAVIPGLLRRAASDLVTDLSRLRLRFHR
jgi:hypothetical protein